MERTSKLRNIKYITDNLFHIEDILRCELESTNRGCFVLTTSGQLYIFSWIKKKIVYKVIQDISDALWQYEGESELVASCHTGAFLRYTLQHDTGLTCSLQLSAPTFLGLLKNKDPNILAVKSMKLWGHSKDFILAQPQPDKLVILSTNSGDRPQIIDIIRTAPLRSAHLVNSQIIAQPITGSDIYIHDAKNGKTTEIITVKPARSVTSYIEWGALTCSFSTARFALTDSERRIYLGDITEKKFLSKKGGITKNLLTLHQIVWPASIRPLSLHHLSMTFSRESLSLFCTGMKNEKEMSYYLFCKLKDQGMLSLIYEFDQATFLIPGLMHELPDLFFMENGIFVLLEESPTTSKAQRGDEIEGVMHSLKTALQGKDLAEITHLKAKLEQDLCIFLSLCNHLDDWLELAKNRSEHFTELVDVILSHLTKLSMHSDDKKIALSIKELTKHLFKTMQEEIHNVLNYVDAEDVSQMLLQMSEQMKFYSVSIETLLFPESDSNEQELLSKFEVWGDKSAREILLSALEEDSVQIAESYLKLKPWIYGEMDSRSIVSLCVDIAKENPSAKLINKLGMSYCEVLKEMLFSSKELSEILLLDGLLQGWNALSDKEKLCLHLLKHIYISSPYLITRPLSFWQELISYGDSEEMAFSAPLGIEHITVEVVSKLTDLSIMLILADLYARISNVEILSPVSPEALWEYLLIKNDKETLLQWILNYLGAKPDDVILCNSPKSKENSPTNCKIFEKEELAYASSSPQTKIIVKDTIKSISNSPDSSSFAEKMESIDHTDEKNALYSDKKSPAAQYNRRTRKISLDSLLGYPLYASDAESLCSIESSNPAGQGVMHNRETTLPYIFPEWPESYFKHFSQAMVDKIPTTSDPLSHELLNLLSQFGIFVTEEKNDTRKIVQRWFSIPNFDLRIKDCAFDSKVDQVMVDKCIFEKMADLNEYSPFYEYAHVNNLSQQDDSFKDIELQKPWIRLAKQFMNSPLQSNVFELSINNLDFLISSLPSKDIPQSIIFSTFLTMLVAPNANLRDFCSIKDEHMVPSSLEKAEEYFERKEAEDEVVALSTVLAKANLTPYCVLKRLSQTNTYLEFLVNEQVCPTEIDVSMYDLLNGNIPFDLESLFTFQKSNKYGYVKDSKMPTIITEGGQQPNSKCYLDFCYYLKSGRPTFAYASLLKERSTADTNFPKGLEWIEELVYGLALSSWPDQKVCSACVALLFMTECNFSLLKDIIFVANFVLESWGPELNTSISEDLCQSQLSLVTHEIKVLLVSICSLSTRNECISKLISYFEEVIIAFVTKQPLCISEQFSGAQNLKSMSFHKQEFSEEHIYYLFSAIQTGVRIANAYQLSLPTRILEFFAINERWIVFLAAVHLFNYPRKLVLKTSQKFPSDAIREHLFYALNSAHYERICDKDQTPEAKSTGEVRKSLYSKIGIGTKQSNLAYSSTSSSESLSKTPPNLTSNMEEIPNLAEDGSVAGSDSHFSTSSLSSSSFISICDSVDLMAIFLHCYKKVNPIEHLLENSSRRKIPALAVFASCLPEGDPAACLSAWLCALLSKKQSSDLLYSMQCLSSTSLNEDCLLPTQILFDNEKKKEVLKLLVFSHLHFGHLDILKDGLRIFFKKTYIMPILDSLELAKNGDLPTVISRTLNSVNSLPEKSECILSIRSMWLQKFCLEIIKCGIDNYLINSLQKKYFLEALLPLQNTFPYSCDSLDWNSIFRIKEITLKVPGPFKVKDIIDMYLDNKVEAIGNEMIQFLTASHQYDVALKLASFLSLDISIITCQQLIYKFCAEKEKFEETFNGMLQYFDDIYSKVVASSISPRKACDVFESMGEESPHSSSSFICYSYAMMWLDKHSKKNIIEIDPEVILSDQRKLCELESKAWVAYISCKIKKDMFYDEICPHPPKPFDEWPWETKAIEEIFHYNRVMQRTTLELSEKGSSTVSGSLIQSKDFTQEILKLISDCLDESLLITAVRIAKHFSIKNKDVDTLMSLLEAAGKLTFSREDTDSSSQTLKSLSRTRNRGISFNSSFNFLPHSSESNDNGRNIASCINLVSELEHGRQLAKRILMLCRVSEAVKCPYSDLLMHEEQTMLLKSVLALQRCDSTQVAKELIEGLPISFAEVNRLLVEEAIATITAGPGDSGNEYHGSLLSWNDLEERWQELLTLTDNPTSIGQQLLQIGENFGSSQHDQLQRVHSISVELVIRAHDCFSYAANMEGISTVLQKCLTLVKSLLRTNFWQLMVRLLTGISRYSEMLYVFDILRENDQFEHLLGRISDKKLEKSGLDQALVHYLRVKHPNDKETLKLVALHFLLYSEVAKMYEEEGKAAIEKVLKDSLVRDPESTDSSSQRSTVLSLFWRGSDISEAVVPSSSKDAPSGDKNIKTIFYLSNADPTLLSRAMDCYAHAAQYCLQEKKMVKALYFSRQAQLIALQLSFVNNQSSSKHALCFLGLSSSAVRIITTQHLNVEEALIVARAYELSVDWPAAIHHHFIKNSENDFLQSYLLYTHLTHDLVLEITKRIEAEQNSEHANRMSKLLIHVQDIPLVYQVASRLSLRDVVEQCLKSPAMSYLKDTVFIQGYANS